MNALDLIDVTSRNDADVIIERGGVEQAQVRSKDRSPIGRATALRELSKCTKTGDTLRLGGLWNHALVSYHLPVDVTLAGLGNDLTTMICSQESQVSDCGFEIMGRNLVLEDLTLIWQPKDDKIRGGQTLGMTGNKGRSATSTTGKRLKVIGKGMCALYFWGDASGHKATFEDCQFFAGRWCACIGSGSGDDAAILTLNNCELTTDFAKYGGAGGDMGTPPNNSGLVIRGGQCVMNGGKINVVGYPGSGIAGDNNKDPFQWAIGACCSSLGDKRLPTYTYPWPYLTLNGVEIRLDATLAAKRLDVWQHIGTVTVNDGSGSGNGGTYLSDGNVKFGGTAKAA